MKYIYIYTILVFSLVGCNETNTEQDVYFGGEIINPKSNYVVFMLHDKVIDTLYLKKDNSFGKKITNLNEGLYSFKHDYEYQHIYLQPNDSIRVRLNTWDFDETLVFDGKGAERNELLLTVFLENEKTNYYKYYQLSEKEFNEKLAVKSAQYYQLLEILKTDNTSLSDDYIHLVKAAIDYPLYRLKEIYPYRHSKYLPKNSTFTISDSFYDYRNTINLNDDKLSEFYAYQNFVSTHIYNLAYQKDLSSGFGTAFSMQVLDIISQKIQLPNLKNKLLTDEIFNAINNNSYKISEKQLNIYYANCSDSVTVNKVKLLLEDKRMLKEKMKFPDLKVWHISSEKEVSVNSILKNSNTFLNFWTTKSLSVDYLNNRMQYLRKKHPNIKFISINIDEKKVRSTYKIKHQNDQYYIATDAKDAYFLKSKYPRCILIDSDGVISNGFSILTNSGIEKDLEKMLKANTISLAKGFVYVKDYIPSIQIEMRYAGNNNFIGKPIVGYKSSRLILTKKATLALEKVQQDLQEKGYGLKIFDGYRPQQAVNHFISWAKNPTDTLMKETYYPNISKKLLFKKGFIASRSGHSRGSTVDLTLVNLETKQEIDMGSPFDFFGSISSVNYSNITSKQKENRQLLQQVMKKHNFRPYHKEWWHFTLRNEPFPKTYFDFMIE